MKNDRVGTACVCVRGIISTVTPRGKSDCPFPLSRDLFIALGYLNMGDRHITS